ncbi:fungal-specific transcription factor domain-containing protein [Exophiala viscosa]|uniref:Fungal-specific transcription factor domain-containing protein n=1 Tax=Exophiala viscosa TaxID=2486360 RepID=A0AAN6DRR1_9EURO|nr:fungal-specific transcription factor domain-containing protein [Exophiala viscosa]KAI1623822.1 fungal-specific transcription factor domain-containing protein [Exophiala viscosa]
MLCKFHNRDCTFGGPRRRPGPPSSQSPRQISSSRSEVRLDSLTAGLESSNTHWRLIRTRQGHDVKEYDQMMEPSIMKKTLGLLNTHHCRYASPASSFKPVFVGTATSSDSDETDASTTRLRWVSPTDAFLLIPDLGTPAYSQEREDLEAIESLVRPYGPMLVDIYFRVVYSSFPVLHRAVFEEKYGRSPSEFAPASLGIVYLLAARHWSYQPSLQDRPMPDVVQLESLTRKSLQDAMRYRPKLSTIQAGLQLLQYSSTNAAELTAQLVNNAYEIGFHLDASQWDIPDWEKALRKRLSWAMYIQDKWCSLEAEMPALINSSHWGVRKITEQDFPDQHEYDREGSSDVEKGRLIFCQLIFLSEILGDILDDILSIRATTEVAAAGPSGLELLLQTTKPLQIRLRKWFADLSELLSMEVSNVNRLSSVGSLRLAYIATEMALHRQILLALPICGDSHLIQLCQKAAADRFIFAIDLLKSLKSSHLASFWFSMAAQSFALAGEYGCYVYLAESDPSRREIYHFRLREHRWLLTMNANSGAKFIRQALNSLEVPFKCLTDVDMTAECNVVDGDQMSAFDASSAATGTYDYGSIFNDWLDDSLTSFEW